MGFVVKNAILDEILRRGCRRLRAIIAALIPSMCGAETALAGAWTLPAGEGQIISTTLYDTANRAFDADRDLVDDVFFQKIESSIFVERGLTDRITFVGSTSYQTVNYTAESGPDAFEGLGDISIGLRYNVSSGSDWVLSVQPSFVIDGGGETIPDADLGAGNNSVDLRILYGRSGKFIARPYFLDAQMGTRIRSSGDVTKWYMDLTGGYHVSERLTLISQAFLTNTNGQTLAQDIILPNQSFKVQGSIVVKLRETLSLQVGAFQTLAGKNIVEEKAGFIGIWLSALAFAI